MTSESELPEVDWDEVVRASYDATLVGPDNELEIVAVVQKIQRDAFEAGRQSVLRDGAVRTAMLDAKMYWLDSADKADGAIGKQVATLIANVFGDTADTYRMRTPVIDNTVELPTL